MNEEAGSSGSGRRCLKQQLPTVSVDSNSVATVADLTGLEGPVDALESVPKRAFIIRRLRASGESRKVPPRYVIPSSTAANRA